MIPLFMFITALLFLFLGVSVAFAFGMVAFIFALISPELGLDIFNILPFRIFGIMSNTTLMSVPLFILMGTILEKSKLAEDLLISMSTLFKSMRGGLAISVVLVGALLAASTGIVSASVVMMSIIALPLMLKSGYSHSLSSGTIIASGTLGQIIPPSIILIILGDVMNVSVGELFLAAINPSIILVSLYIVYIIIFAYLVPSSAPAIVDDKKISYIKLIKSILPLLVLMIVVLGSIFTGIATPTESAAFGVIGSIILSFYNGSLSYGSIKKSLEETISLSGMIFMILIGATAFSLVFNELGGNDMVLAIFENDISNAWSFIFIAMLVIFILGFFIDFIEISFIIVPILVPIVNAFGIDPIWFAVLIALNLQASFLTPPFGLALFFFKGSAKDNVSILSVYKGVLPFILLQLLTILIVMLFPDVVFAYL